MTFRERAEDAAKAVFDVMQASPTDGQTKQVVDAVEQAIVEAVLDEQQRCVHVAMDCCSADRDLAHKLGEEIRRSEVALIANLSALR